MQVVVATEPFRACPRPWVYLAGDVTNGSNWQARVVADLTARDDLPGTLLNPRRAGVDASDQMEIVRQITWEHEALWQADVVAFWLSVPVQPMLLFDLGQQVARRTHDAWIAKGQLPARRDWVRLRKLVIGLMAAYPFATAVRVQAALAAQAALEQRTGAHLAATYWAMDLGVYTQWVRAAVESIVAEDTVDVEVCDVESCE